jgi:hypothetical protein
MAHVANGDRLTIQVTIPAMAARDGGRSVYGFAVDSLNPQNLNFYHPWPIMVVVP